VNKPETLLLVADSLLDLPAPIAGSAEHALAQDLRERLRRWEKKFARAQRPATLKAVRSDWQTFFGWCQAARVAPLPVVLPDLVQFLTDMLVMGRRRATLNRYVYTVTTIHAAAGLADPTQHPDWPLEWKALVARLADLNRNGSRQAQPLQADGIARILATLGDSPHDLRDAALLSMASDTLCRESELAALTLEDLERTGENWTFHLGRAKNDPEGIGSDRFVSAATKARLDAWCAVAGITRGFVFLPIGGGAKHDPKAPPHLRPAEIAKIFRRRAQRAQLPDYGRVSGHSARVGSTVDLLENGYSTTDAQFAGGWKSERMVLKYGQRALAGRNAMASMRARKSKD
jgi:integrase